MDLIRKNFDLDSWVHPLFFDGMVLITSDTTNSDPVFFLPTPYLKQPPSCAIPNCRQAGTGS